MKVLLELATQYGQLHDLDKALTACGLDHQTGAATVAEFCKERAVVPPDWLSTLPETPQDRHRLTPDTLLDFGPAEGLRLSFLDNFALPSIGTTIYGAKTGNGKTTFLVNVMREAHAQGKKVSFLTYEMNPQEIALALALSMFAKSSTEPIPHWTRNDDGPGERIYCLNRLADGLPPLSEDDNPDFVDTFSRVKTFIAQNGSPPDCLQTAYESIRQALADGSLDIVDAPGDVDAMAVYVRATSFDMYLIDYIQIIPPPAGVTKENYKGTQAVCNVLRQLGNSDKKCLVAGAQFNRTTGDETTIGAFDPRPEQFREAADIEQLATLALGIGYQPGTGGKREFFYKILKHRYAGRMNGAKMKSGGYFEFFFAQRGGRWTAAEKWENPKANRKPGLREQKILDHLSAAKGPVSRQEIEKLFDKKDHANQTIMKMIEKQWITEIAGLLELV